MKKLFILCIFFIGGHISYVQGQALNMVELAQWDIPGQFYNDIWGFTDSQGNEYAVMGSRPKIHFFNVSNPSSPILVDEFSNGNPVGLQMNPTSWRDFKVYGNYCYAVSDNNDEGLLIFDLSNLPNSVSLANQITTHFEEAHNIFIDTNNGKLYVAGSDTEYYGLIVLDLAANPTNPPVLGTPYFGTNPGYVHDLFAKNDIVYTCHGYNDFYIWDLTNISSPTALSSNNISGGYVHSVWLSDNGQWAFVAEELPRGQPLAVVDISDPYDISVEHTFKFPLLAPTHIDNTPHNPFVKDTLLYVSYYEDGVQVFNISDPLNPTQLAYFDTEPNNTDYNGTTNNWGVYPYLPSGTIIASDFYHGLFTLELDFTLLPLELTSFEAQKRVNDILLNWETAQEEGVSHIEIQKRTNFSDFETIGKINSPGYSQQTQFYDFVDENPVSGEQYYRLKIVDLDGSYTFSMVKTIFWDKADISIFPTLIDNNQEIKINLPYPSKTIEITFFNLSGQTIQQNIITDYDKNHLTVATNQLSSGTYVFSVKTDLNLISKKIIKL